MQLSKRSNRGFTVVEVIVAISILTVGLLGTLPLLYSSVSSNIQSKNRSMALYLADQQVDKIKSWSAYETQTDKVDSDKTVKGIFWLYQYEEFWAQESSGWACNNNTGEGLAPTDINECDTIFPGEIKCCFEKDVRSHSGGATFNRTTAFFRNGFSAGYKCEVDKAIVFDFNSESVLHEGYVYKSVQDEDGASFSTDRLYYEGASLVQSNSLNHHGTKRNYNAKKGCYAGEDFTLVHVVVSWNDIAGYHNVKRDLFIRGK